MLAKLIGDLGQDALDFTKFVFAQSYELIVQTDRFQRFDKQRPSGPARAVDDTIYASLMPSHNRHHVAVLADRHKVFLQSAVRPVRAQEPFERFFNALLLASDVAPDAPECHACVIRQASVRQENASVLPR